MELKDSYQAQASLDSWTVRAGLYEASAASVHDPQVIALCQRVVACADVGLADKARATVTLRNGCNRQIVRPT